MCDVSGEKENQQRTRISRALTIHLYPRAQYFLLTGGLCSLLRSEPGALARRAGPGRLEGICSQGASLGSHEGPNDKFCAEPCLGLPLFGWARMGGLWCMRGKEVPTGEADLEGDRIFVAGCFSGSHVGSLKVKASSETAFYVTPEIESGSTQAPAPACLPGTISCNMLQRLVSFFVSQKERRLPAASSQLVERERG